MKITLRELLESSQALDSFLKSPLEVKLAYRIRKIVGKIQDELKHIESMRQELFKKYGEPVKDDKGIDTGRLNVPPSKIDAFQKEFEEMLKVEVDLGAQKIPFEAIEAMGKISMEQMAVIEKFLEEPEAPAKVPQKK